MARTGRSAPSRRQFLRAGSTGLCFAAGLVPATLRAATRDPRGSYDPRGGYTPRGTPAPAPGYDPRGGYKPPKYDPRAKPPIPRADERRKAQMTYHTLGKTGLSCSRIAFDCSALAFNTRTVLEEAIAHGINTLFISPGRANGLTVCRVVRDVLAKERGRVHLLLEAEPFEPDIKRWLRELRVDSVDVVLTPASTVEDVRQPVRRTRFEALRRTGKARFFGHTCYGRQIHELILAAAKLEYVSVLCCPYPLVARDELDRFLAWARRQKIGTMARDVLSGPLGDADNVVPALRDVYRRGVVDTTLIPFGSHTELQAFLRVASAERLETGGPVLHPPAR